MVRGADGKEYGPVSFEQFTNWINVGRVTPRQEVKRSDMQDWAVASAFQEFQTLFSPTALLPPPTPTVMACSPAAAARISPSVPAQMKSGASWFYWIAALSLINSVMSLSGSSFGFALGLGITQIFDAIASNAGGAGKGIAFGLDVAAAGMFVLFGVFAHKAHTWAFLVGILLFAMDALLALIGQAWMSLALHALALFYLFRGMQACRELRRAVG
jgi:hypothetical protein